MRVVFNQLAALGPKTGIGHYTDQLFQSLCRREGESQVVGFPQGYLRIVRKIGNRVRSYLDTGDDAKQTLRKAALGHLRDWAKVLVARNFARFCTKGRYDLYHEPNFIPLPCEVPTVATLHDLSVLLHPEWHPKDRVVFFERHFPRTLKHCVHFLTDSEFGRQEVIRVLGVSPKRVTRAYNGIRPNLAPLPKNEVSQTLRRLGLPAQYLLHVGTIEPRKNVLMLLRAYGDMPAEIRERWPLVLVGGWGWNAIPVAEHLDRVGRRQGIVQLGYLADDDLAAVYNGARALVFPSHYEGFGLPPLEMMACGGAVLASTAGALIETVGTKAHLIAPDDIDGWRNSMIRVTADNDWWQSLRDGAEEVSRPFTWDRCAADTLAVYESLCEKSADNLKNPAPADRGGARAA